MLPKKNRLTRREIEQLKAEKIRLIQGIHFALVFKKNDLPGKFGLIIPNRVVPKSSERNRIKRLLYQVIKEKRFNLRGLFLFLAKKGCEQGVLEGFMREMEDFERKII